MFEQEIAMEKQQSSVLPLLLIITLIVSLVGVAVYYVIENRKVLASEEATTLVNASLKGQEPVTIHFQTGAVVASVDEKTPQPALSSSRKGWAPENRQRFGPDNGDCLDPEGRGTSVPNSRCQ